MSRDKKIPQTRWCKNTRRFREFLQEKFETLKVNLLMQQDGM